MRTKCDVEQIECRTSQLSNKLGAKQLGAVEQVRCGTNALGMTSSYDVLVYMLTLIRVLLDPDQGFILLRILLQF